MDKELEAAAIEHFKKENPHLAHDEYFQSPEKSMTIRAYIAGARWQASRPVPELESAAEKWAVTEWIKPGTTAVDAVLFGARWQASRPVPPVEEWERETRCQYPEKDIKKACRELIKLAQNSTKVVSWYPHKTEVRGPFCRWLEITAVQEQYRDHVATQSDEARFVAYAMNNAESIARAHLSLQAQLQEMERKLRAADAGYERNFAEKMQLRRKVIDLEKEVERLESSLGSFRDANECNRKCLARVAELEKENARIREALRFYASEDNWEDIYFDGGEEPGDIQHGVSHEDVEYRRDEEGEITYACAGKTAREALAGAQQGEADAVKILHKRYISGNPDREKSVQEERDSQEGSEK